MAKTFVISDLHGQMRLLDNFLEVSGMTEDDGFVVAGDNCDIGSQTWEVEDRLAELGAVVLSGNHECFAEDTELLTSEGWLHHSKVHGRTLVATLSEETDCLEWQRPTRVVRRRYDGDMYEVSDRHVSILVTPGHRVHYAKRRSLASLPYKWRREEAERSLTQNNSAVFRVSVENGNEDYPISDDEIRLSAWLLTDGYRAGRGYHTFYQRASKAHLIRGCLERLGLNYTERSRTPRTAEICGRRLLKEPEVSVEFSVRKPHNSVLQALMPEAKRVPEWAYSLSKRQADIFIQTVIDGDGSRRTETDNCAVIYPGTEEIANDLQRLCIVNGYRVSWYRYRGEYIRLNLTKTQTKEIKHLDRAVRTVPYSGTVWCVTVPNDNVLVRRNGCVSVMGNCAHVFGIEIHPYDVSLDPEYRHFLAGVMALGERPLAVAVDGVLVSHAGVSVKLAALGQGRPSDERGSETLLHALYSTGTLTAETAAEALNVRFMQMFQSDGKELLLVPDRLLTEPFYPLWFRPYSQGDYGNAKDCGFYNGFKQVVGHTPSGYFSGKQLDLIAQSGTYLIDPYSRKNFTKRGYMRWAEIEDGKVTVKISGVD